MLLNDVQTAIRDAVHDWTQDRVMPYAQAWEREGGYPPAIFAELAALGLMGMTAPAEYGGAEADYVSYALALMELAAGDGGLSTVVSVHNAPVIAALLQQGSPEQKARFLPELCAGRIIGAFGLTEAGAGSDASALRTRARRDGDDYVIAGSQQLIT